MTNQLTFLKPFIRGWIIILAFMIAAYMTAMKYLSYVTPMYESTAKLRLADLQEGVPNSNLFKDLDVFANSQKIQAEIELIKSHSIIKKALSKVPFQIILVRQGKLKNTELFNDSPIHIDYIHIDTAYQDKPFYIKISDTSHISIIHPEGDNYKGSLTDTIRMGSSSIVISLNTELLHRKPNANVNDYFTLIYRSEDKQVSEIIKQLDVSTIDKDVPVIRISYKSSHPEKAALFPNALAEAYIEDYIETKYTAANVTSDFLNDRINEINSKLVNTESEILSYRRQNSITNIRQETETDLRKISQMKIQQTNLKMSLDAVKLLEGYIEKGKDNFLELAPNFESFTDLLSTELIKKIKQLQAERKALLLEFTPLDEKVIVLDQNIHDISSYIIESIKNTRENLQSKYDILCKDITDAEQVFVSLPEKERMMTILNREFEIYQQSYNFLNQKRIEAEIAKAAKVAFHRIITPAGISLTPVSPNRIIIKAVSVILGMMGGVVLIFIVHLLKAKVNDISTVEKRSLTPIIAAVPKFKTNKENRHFFLTMLAQWKVKALLKAGGMICFTGFDNAHGATFITNQVADTLIKQSSRVLLVRFGDVVSPSSFWEIKHVHPNKSVMTFDNDKISFKKIEDIQQVLLENRYDFDQTILINSVFGEVFTLAFMAIADLNVVCIDTRLTPAKRIIEVDLIKEDYDLPQVYFAVNRVAYNPSFIGEICRAVSYFLAKAKNRE